MENKAKLVFASGNKHKLSEAQSLFKNSFSVISMRQLGFDGEIDEPGETLLENARIKANFIHDLFNVDCFSDDTGLEIDGLDGAPGVYSARYAGLNCSFQDNVKKVLVNMSGMENRKARFVTIVYLILDGEHFYFEGIIEGQITKTQRGKEGFGYDPIFIPEGYSKTFAEMSLSEKSSISHRGLAMMKLKDFLSSR